MVLISNTISNRVKLLISYDGTDYCGWQRQINSGKPSIQETLENALEKVFKEPIKCIASGRTDSGVHAMGQIVHFDAPKDPSRINFVRALEGILPNTIVTHHSEIVSKEFHAQLSAKAKTYRYRIWTHSAGPTFLRRYCHWYPYPFSFDKLKKLAKALEGKQDFKSFESVGTNVPHTIRTIYRARWVQSRPHLYYFEVTGNGFLKQMVRNLVGTQLYYMQKNKNTNELIELIRLKDRTKAGYTAPPQGLVLVKVYY